MTLANDIKPYRTVLVILPARKYTPEVLKLTRQIQRKKACFITLNKTYDALMESFSKSRIRTKNFVFIDAITNTFKKAPAKKDNCYFVSSPAALTEMSILLTKVLSEKFDVVVFDSLTNLFTFHKRPEITGFVSHLVNKIRESNSRAVFFAIAIAEQEALISQASMYFEKIVEIK